VLQIWTYYEGRIMQIM